MFSIKSQLQDKSQNSQPQQLDMGSTRGVFIHSDPNYVIKKLLHKPDNIPDANTIEAETYSKYGQKYSILTPCKKVGDDLVMKRIKTNLADFLEDEFSEKFDELEDITEVNEQVFNYMYNDEINQVYDLAEEAGLDLMELLCVFNWMLDEDMNLWLIDYGLPENWKEV